MSSFCRCRYIVTPPSSGKQEETMKTVELVA